MEDVKKDQRFSHIVKDSRFHRMPRKHRKVTIDNRFKSMFSDKRFKTKYQVDKRGRPVQTSTNENLKDYYELDSSDDDEENKTVDNDRKQEKKSYEKKKKEQDSEDLSEDEHSDKREESSLSGDEDSEEVDNGVKVTDDSNSLKKCSKKKAASSSESESEDDEKATASFQTMSDAIKKGIDVARGEGMVSSSDDDDSDSDSGLDTKDEDLDHKWGELEGDAVEAKEISCRLALCNMDWDRIKAQDILLLLNSFKPQAGTVSSVKIYPSEYGVKRMDEDNRLGPVELRSEKVDSDDDSEAEDSTVNQEKLRQYQINRLKYYYAVVTCDTPETADAIYEQCDGLEYETSSAKIDLRFIPDDMEFDHEPTSVADKVIDGVAYKPSQFITSALNQTKVNLTWEETDPDRLKQTMRKFTKDEVDDMDLKAYLASDSDDEDDETVKTQKTSNEINKFRSLLGTDEKTEKVEDGKMEMEISWEPGLKEATEDVVKKKTKEKQQTPWDKYLEKRAEKRRQKLDEKMKKKDDLEKGKNDNDESDDDDIPAGVDMNDPYFKDAFSDDEAPSTKLKEKKEKKKKKKTKVVEETNPDLDLLVMDEDDDKRHFSLEKIMKDEKNKKKKKNKKAKEIAPEDNFQLDLSDDRFSAMFSSSAYNIDPSAPDYKKTKATQMIVDEKQKRRAKAPEQTRAEKRRRTDESAVKKQQSVEDLVRSVKANTKLVLDKKKSKSNKK